MLELKCNKNCHDHIDYNHPILPEHSDFRTSYHRAHDYINTIPQDFDCRVKLKINQDLLKTDVRVKDEIIPTTKKDYGQKSKQDDLLVKYGRIWFANYNRGLQEIFTKAPPPTIELRASEMKDNYRYVPWAPSTREILPPDVEGRCEVTGLARALQPGVPVENDGYWKYLDNYMTSNRSSYKHYDENEMRGSRRDVPTIYNVTGVYPKSRYILKDPESGNKEMYDRDFVVPQFPNRNFSKGWKRVPHRGMESEYQGTYHRHTLSDVFPYLHDSGISFPTSVTNFSTPWQTFAPPGMYCTDYCHIGAEYPVRSVLNCVKPDEKKLPHKTLTDKESCLDY